MDEDWEQLQIQVGWLQDELDEPDFSERTFKFAVRVIDALRDMSDNVSTRVIVQQLVKAATMIGASVEEANGTESEQDAIRKLSLAREKAHGAYYWIRVIRASIADSVEWIALQQESKELARALDDLINPAQDQEPD